MTAAAARSSAGYARRSPTDCSSVAPRIFPSKGEWGSADEKLIAHNQQWGLIWGHGPHRVRYSVAYDAEEFKFALDTMAEEAKARVLFHSYACDAIVEGDRIAGVTFQSKSGRFAILAKTVIDASGDGDIFTSAGAPYEKESVLPWLWFTMGGVENAEAAIEKGRWFFRTIGDGRVLLPWGATERVARKIDATEPDDLSYAELACRRRVMEQVDSMRAEIPGFARAHICHIADQLGVTESRRLVGRHVLGATRSIIPATTSSLSPATGPSTNRSTTSPIARC